jgi:hypothetical protein
MLGVLVLLPVVAAAAVPASDVNGRACAHRWDCKGRKHSGQQQRIERGPNEGAVLQRRYGVVRLRHQSTDGASHLRYHMYLPTVSVSRVRQSEKSCREARMTPPLLILSCLSTWIRYTLEDGKAQEIQSYRIYHLIGQQHALTKQEKRSPVAMSGTAAPQIKPEKRSPVATSGTAAAAAAATTPASQRGCTFVGTQRFLPRATDGDSSAAQELTEQGWVQFVGVGGDIQGAILQGEHGAVLRSHGGGDFAEFHARPPDESAFEEGDVVGIWADGLRRRTVSHCHSRL